MSIQYSNIKPTEDRILVERLESEEKSAGGIIIPDTAKEKPVYGTVLAVGPGKVKECGSCVPTNIKVGDKVLFTQWGGTEIKAGDKKLLIMKESDVLAIIE